MISYYFPKQNGKHPPNISANWWKDVGLDIFEDDDLEAENGGCENDKPGETQNGKQPSNTPANGLRMVCPDIAGIDGVTGCATACVLFVVGDGINVGDDVDGWDAEFVDDWDDENADDWEEEDVDDWGGEVVVVSDDSCIGDSLPQKGKHGLNFIFFPHSTEIFPLLELTLTPPSSQVSNTLIQISQS